MAIRVPPPSQAADKWASRAAAAASDYTNGVQGAGSAWESGVAGASETYAQGVQQAIAERRYAAGVQGKAQKFVSRATTLGPSRYSAGVGQAKDDYTRGVQRFFSVLQGLSLSPRGPKGSPQNQVRANEVAQALHQARF